MAEDHNPQVATQAHDGLITLRLTATDSGEAAARRRLDAAEKQVRALLGSAIFGADETATLPAAVAALLAADRAESRLRRILHRRRNLRAPDGRSGHQRLPAGIGGDLQQRIEDPPAGSAARDDSARRRRERRDRRGDGARHARDFRRRCRPERSPASPGRTAERPPSRSDWFTWRWPTPPARASRRLVSRGNRQQIKDRAAKSGLNMLRLYLEGQTAQNG